MRLIDADALLLHLADYQLQESPGWGANGHGSRDAYEAITNCIKAVEDAPTIEPERKKGFWKGKPLAGFGTVRCSCCGDVFRENEGKWNFCPSCGADMRGEQE